MAYVIPCTFSKSYYELRLIYNFEKKYYTTYSGGAKLFVYNIYTRSWCLFRRGILSDILLFCNDCFHKVYNFCYFYVIQNIACDYINSVVIMECTLCYSNKVYSFIFKQNVAYMCTYKGENIMALLLFFKTILTEKKKPWVGIQLINHTIYSGLAWNLKHIVFPIHTFHHQNFKWYHVRIVRHLYLFMKASFYSSAAEPQYATNWIAVRC